MNKFALTALISAALMLTSHSALARDYHDRDRDRDYRSSRHYDDHDYKNRGRYKKHVVRVKRHNHRTYYSGHRHYRGHDHHDHYSSNDYWKFVGGHILLNEVLYHSHTHDRYCRH